MAPAVFPVVESESAVVAQLERLKEGVEADPELSRIPSLLPLLLHRA